MMNRIFKRPMFRMGGRSDDGIMSVRRGYQEGGDQVTKLVQNINLVKHLLQKQEKEFSLWT